MILRNGLLLLFACSSFAMCQVPATDSNPEQFVKHALADASSGMYNGFTERELSRFGDASSVAMAKIIGGREVTKQDAEGILLVMTLSFSAPRLIRSAEDKHPRAALFVLKYLDATTSDQSLKDKIAATRTLVRAAEIKALDAAPTKP